MDEEGRRAEEEQVDLVITEVPMAIRVRAKAASEALALRTL
jgi:hypothetical protein